MCNFQVNSVSADGTVKLRDDPSSGAHFTNSFMLALQIRWKICLAVIQKQDIRLQQIFVHTMTAQLLCHVQNFVAKRSEILIKFELWWINHW